MEGKSTAGLTLVAPGRPQPQPGLIPWPAPPPPSVLASPLATVAAGRVLPVPPIRVAAAICSSTIPSASATSLQTGGCAGWAEWGWIARDGLSWVGLRGMGWVGLLGGF